MKNKQNIFLYFLLIFSVALLFLSIPYFIKNKDKNNRSQKLTMESIQNAKKYYENLPTPPKKMTSQKVVAIMKKLGGLLEKDSELIRTVEWYVYKGNKRVIKQLIVNLENEIEVYWPQETKILTNHASVPDDLTKKSLRLYMANRTNRACILNNRGRSYKILSNPHGLFWAVNPIVHQEFHRIASLTDVNKPDLIYLFFCLMGKNEKIIEKDCDDPDFEHGGGKYHDIYWYNEELVKEDVLAFLRVYKNYKAYEEFRDFNWVIEYPGDWLSLGVMKKAFELVDKDGVETGYQYFLDHFEEGMQLIDSGLDVEEYVENLRE